MKPPSSKPPEAKPCFVCNVTVTLLKRSLTQRHGPPVNPKDAVHICSQCNDDWSATLDVIADLDRPTTP